MAQLPHFVFSPNTLLSVIGLMRGADTTRPAPAENWRDATVDVIIPAHNEADNIVRCLASVVRQTQRPRQIILVDDGSSDDTARRARTFCEFHGIPLVVVQRRTSRGKTPSIKEQARALDSDVLFVLDADTVLQSDNYIGRAVHDLYQAVGIASACGIVLPLQEKDRRAVDESPAVQAFVEAFPGFKPSAPKSRLRRVASGLTNAYRDVLYLYLQRFVYRGQMAAFGTTCNPVGCAVAYRREYLKALFDHFEPTLGDDLTNSEDIFIGLAMLDAGYRHVHLIDVCARTVEPEIHRLPKQVHLWSSAFLQSAFYFDALLKSPFKALKRWRLSRRQKNGSDGGPQPVTAQAGAVAFAGVSGTPHDAFLSIATDITHALPGRLSPISASGTSAYAFPAGDRRRIPEPYRQAFGREHTAAYGRPVGWVLMSSTIEKIGFPTALLITVLLRNWEGLLVTVCAETLITVTALAVVMKNQRVKYFIKGLAITPIRYALLAWELATIARFAADMWLTKNRRWRK